MFSLSLSLSFVVVYKFGLAWRENIYTVEVSLPWNLTLIGLVFLPMERMFWFAPTRPALTFSGRRHPSGVSIALKPDGRAVRCGRSRSSSRSVRHQSQALLLSRELQEVRALAHDRRTTSRHFKDLFFLASHVTT